MNRRSILVLLGALAALRPLAACAEEMASSPTDVTAIVDGDNRFALDLYHKLCGRSGNLIFSPYSLSTALAMTYAGARGSTAAEMESVLHFPFTGAKLHKDFRALQARLNSMGGRDSTELAVANRLWGQKGFRFLRSFLDTTRADYGADLGEVDFRRHLEDSRREINGWVAGKTNGRIPEILDPGVLDPNLTRLALTDAIYFKAPWAETFRPEMTREKPFHLSSRDTVMVRMMSGSGDYHFAHTSGLSALQKDYRGHWISMLLLLPDRIDGLAALEDSLSPEKIRALVSALKPQQVEVTIPRFVLNRGFSLGEILQEMGMHRAFSDHADFSGMAPERLQIGPVIHKAFISVAEGGTEAAAATVVEMTLGMGSSRQPPQRFTADHPFLFLIRDNGSGAILFLGRVADPRSTE